MENLSRKTRWTTLLGFVLVSLVLGNAACTTTAERGLPCVVDEDCWDGLSCNGTEACIEGVCVAGEPQPTSSPISIDDDIAHPDFKGLHWSGRGYGLLWVAYGEESDTYEIRFRRLSPTGERLEAAEVVFVREQGIRAFASVWNGSEYGIVWAERDVELQGIRLFFGRVSEAGVPSAAAVELDVDNRRDRQTHSLTLIWTGSQYSLVWSETYDSDYRENEEYSLEFMRFGRDGEMLGEQVELVDSLNQQSRPSIVWNGTEHGLTWVEREYENGNGQSRLYFIRYSDSGELLGETLLLEETGDRLYAPMLVWTGNEFGLAWQHRLSRGYYDSNVIAVEFQRISREGNLLGERATLLEGEDIRLPRLTWAETRYHLSWMSANRDEQSPNYGLMDFYLGRLTPQRDALENRLVAQRNIDTQTDFEYSLVHTEDAHALAYVGYEDSHYGNDHLFFAPLPCPL